MKMKHKAVSTLVAAVLGLGVMAPTVHAEAEVSAEVGVASMYYWRGFDLGAGAADVNSVGSGAAVSGDLSVSMNGLYAGLWTSSGDALMGTEYDVYLGYAAEFGDFGIDVGYATYVYPEAAGDLGDYPLASPGDLAEAYIGLSYGPASLTYFENVASPDPNTDYSYVTFGVDVSSFNIAYGKHKDDMAHVDITYNYNDNLSFTLGKVVDNVNDTYNDDMKFLVSLSLPIEF